MELKFASGYFTYNMGWRRHARFWESALGRTDGRTDGRGGIRGGYDNGKFIRVSAQRRSQCPVPNLDPQLFLVS